MRPALSLGHFPYLTTVLQTLVFNFDFEVSSSCATLTQLQGLSQPLPSTASLRVLTCPVYLSLCLSQSQDWGCMRGSGKKSWDVGWGSADPKSTWSWNTCRIVSGQESDSLFLETSPPSHHFRSPQNLPGSTLALEGLQLPPVLSVQLKTHSPNPPQDPQIGASSSLHPSSLGDSEVWSPDHSRTHALLSSP